MHALELDQHVFPIQQYLNRLVTLGYLQHSVTHLAAIWDE